MLAPEGPVQSCSDRRGDSRFQTLLVRVWCLFVPVCVCVFGVGLLRLAEAPVRVGPGNWVCNVRSGFLLFLQVT